MTRAIFARSSARPASRSMMLATVTTSYGDFLIALAPVPSPISALTLLNRPVSCRRVEVAVASRRQLVGVGEEEALGRCPRPRTAARGVSGFLSAAWKFFFGILVPLTSSLIWTLSR